MEKTKFVAQVLLLVTVIPVLFISTIMANDARIRARKAEECNYPSYTADGFIYVNGKKINTRFIISCSNRMAYVKK